MSDSSSDCKVEPNNTPKTFYPASKRPRTILNQSQRKLFKTAFESTPKPCRKVSKYIDHDNVSKKHCLQTLVDSNH